MLYLYGKNIFYYKHISENVKQGRQRFYMPYKSNSKKIYSNKEILRLFEESALSSLLQDINTKDIKIYSKNKKLLSLFKTKFGKSISQLTQKDNKQLIKTIYSPLSSCVPQRKLITHLQTHLNDNDIYHLKENLYNIDFWIHQDICKLFAQDKPHLKKEYDETAILGILAIIRETVLGYFLFQTQLKQSKKETRHNLITEIYINEILHIETDSEIQYIKTILDTVEETMKAFLEIMISTDDNQEFIKI